MSEGVFITFSAWYSSTAERSGKSGKWDLMRGSSHSANGWLRPTCAGPTPEQRATIQGQHGCLAHSCAIYRYRLSSGATALSWRAGGRAFCMFCGQSAQLCCVHGIAQDPIDAAQYRSCVKHATLCWRSVSHHALPEEALALMDAHAECTVDRKTLPLRTQVAALLIQRMTWTHTRQEHHTVRSAVGWLRTATRLPIRGFCFRVTPATVGCRWHTRCTS